MVDLQMADLQIAYSQAVDLPVIARLTVFS